MPCVGWYCSVTKEPVKIDECLRCASTEAMDCDYPLSLLRFYATHIVEEAKVDPDMIRVSAVAWCSRKARIGSDMEFYEDLGSLYNMGRGTAIHECLYFEEPLVDEIMEKRFFRKTAYGVYLTGKPDCIQPKLKKLSDYKCPLHPSKTATFYHKKQLNIYRWMLADPQDETPIKIDHLQVIQLPPYGPPIRMGVDVWNEREAEGYIGAMVRAYLTKPLPPIPSWIGSWACDKCPKLIKERCKSQ